MKEQELQTRAAGDPRLAVHATSPLPAWLWSTDGTRVLWANPVAARLFGASSGTRLAGQMFGPADLHRRQVAQLAHRLSPSGAIRMERLRGFGAALGTLATCACARVDFADGEAGILIVGTEPAGRTMPLLERLHRLVCDADEPVAAFESDGHFVAASPAAATLVEFHTLAEAGLEEARLAALKEGRSQAALGSGQLTLQRVGRSADLGLLAFITPAATQTGRSEVPASKDEPSNTTEEVATSASPEDLAKSDEKAEAAREIFSPDVPRGTDRPASPARRHPLRFMWQMDAQGRFSLGSDAFTRLIGVRTAAGFGRPWREIADVLGLDPEGLVLKAIATREAWSGINLNWPVDDGSHLPVELSGLPIHDGAKNFVGYRGFGVCRDLEGLARLDALRSQEFFNDPPSADMILSENGLPAAAVWPGMEPLEPSIAPPVTTSTQPTSRPSETAQPAQLETPVDTHEEMPTQTPPNVIPFRPLGEPQPPVLSPVENTAFDELARQLSARLEGESAAGEEPSSPPRDVAEFAAAAPSPATSAEPPSWLAEPEPPARGASGRDRVLFDLLPTGVLIYRLDRLLYANRAFLDRMGYASLHALEREGGLDALYVEPGVSSASSMSDHGTPVVISAPHGADEATTAIEARLHTIAWDEDTAHALIFADTLVETASPAAAPSGPEPVTQPSAVGHGNAEELASILDTTADGILMFDAEGNINSCNRSAEALFGYDGAELAQRNLASLLAPESQSVANQYLEGLKGPGAANLQKHTREVRGRARGGGLIPLSLTMGRTQAQGPNFFAVFRDLSQSKKSESELREARRLAERAAHAKADLLARISHEIRTPLNAVIGFADMMIDERFGALGNERYAEYMKDVRASGERVIAVIDDLTDLSRIETGKLDLAFSNQNLNDVVESCVAVMQPQANRERIIIRTSLAHTLPPVMADALVLRQITMNLIGNSIHLANAGGQVIVSTALTDLGSVALRIRDTGQGLNDNEVAAAMEPFRTTVPPDHAPESGVSLSLTKALVEANRAQFNIKTGTRSGTLVEVVFPQTVARAGT